MSDKGLIVRQYPPGVKIFDIGESANEAYFIEEGRVRIYKKKENGMPQELGEARTGDIIGEMALIKGQARTATAEAMEKTKIIVVTRDLMEEKMAKADPLLAAMLRLLVERLYGCQATPI